MALIDNAVDGLAGAVLTGLMGAATLWWTRNSRESRQEEAWQKRADELTELISRQFRNEIAWLRKQLAECQVECRRLNRIINRQNRGDRDD